MSALTERRRESEKSPFALLAAATAVIVFAGFGRTYFLSHWFDAPALTPLVHLHGLLCTSWVLLFALQVRLVATRQKALHRRFGLAGTGLALAMVVVAALTTVAAARHGHSPSAAISPLSFMAIPLFTIIAFGLLVGLAVAFRCDGGSHKRLMLIATVTILSPAIARLPFAFIEHGGPPVFFGLTDLLVVACAGYDAWLRGSLHRMWLWGGALLLGSQVGSLVAAPSAPWLSFARWLTA